MVRHKQAMAGLETLRELAAGSTRRSSRHGGSRPHWTNSWRAFRSLRLDVDVGRPPEAIEASAYFFCSESLTNVVKHADATSASVYVARRRDVLTIEVIDDGIGGVTT